MFGKIGYSQLFRPFFVLLIISLILPLVVPQFFIYLIALIFVTGLLAMSLNIVLGHGGMLQFHHAVFYGASAYTFALILTKTSLPFWIGFLAGPIMATLLGLIIGFICIRLRKFYFGMFQIAAGSLIWIVICRWYNFTGGDDGIYGIVVPACLSTLKSSYFFILFILVICLALMYMIFKSPFGLTLQATRDNPQRCKAIGINVRRYRLGAIVLGTFFAGIAGALFVVLERSVFPDLLFWVFSLEIFIMCLLGGWFTFAGPMIGAAIVVGLKTFVGIYTEYWPFILGCILIFFIFFLPEGILGFLLNKGSARTPGSSERGNS